jgi:hypothetical protein
METAMTQRGGVIRSECGLRPRASCGVQHTCLDANEEPRRPVVSGEQPGL